jgi:hypothetical protein
MYLPSRHPPTFDRVAHLKPCAPVVTILAVRVTILLRSSSHGPLTCLLPDAHASSRCQTWVRWNW